MAGPLATSGAPHLDLPVAPFSIASCHINTGNELLVPSLFETVSVNLASLNLEPIFGIPAVIL